MIDDIIESTREWDRSVADAMELVSGKVDRGLGEVSGMTLSEYPLDDRESKLFHLAMTFGALVDRQDVRESSPIEEFETEQDHMLTRQARTEETQIVLPARNGMAIADVTHREITDDWQYECSCGESFDDQTDAKRHVMT